MDSKGSITTAHIQGSRDPEYRVGVCEGPLALALDPFSGRARTVQSNSKPTKNPVLMLSDDHSVANSTPGTAAPSVPTAEGQALCCQGCVEGRAGPL